MFGRGSDPVRFEKPPWRSPMSKYVFVTGGVVSSLGKGITAASLGNILKARHLSVSLQKLDPYLNVDPGTMSPYQHGEVFVTDDGAETDLDLGHYERFVDENLTVASNVTTGKIYQEVIARERRGDYLGATVQVIPHFTDVPRDAVVSVPDVDSIYEVPLMLEAAGLGKVMAKHFEIDDQAHVPENGPWIELVDRIKHPRATVPVAVVGKYVALPDAYLSVIESLRHAGIHHNVAVDIRWVSSEKLDAGDTSPLMGVAGIVVPGGFGYRGIEGKVIASRYARHNRIPYLGLCLGMQCAVIDFARETLDAPDANSTEFAAFTSTPVIDLMPEQRNVDQMGGSMRLGLYPCKLVPGSLAQKAYGEEIVYERHRHRFAFNNEYREVLGDAGMVFSGVSPNGRLVEIVELADHPWFVASQFHPEFRSRPNRAHPLFRDFVRAAFLQSGIDQMELRPAELLEESEEK